MKSLAVDLAAIPDPDLVSLPEIHAGDVGLGDPFRVTCESVEAIHPISGNQAADRLRQQPARTPAATRRSPTTPS